MWALGSEDLSVAPTICAAGPVPKIRMRVRDSGSAPHSVTYRRRSTTAPDAEHGGVLDGLAVGQFLGQQTEHGRSAAACTSSVMRARVSAWNR
jgi:hypothetical protein